MLTLQGAVSPARFRLRKWYLDAVAESGEVFIGYRADLRWGRLGVSYAAAMTGGALEARTRSTVRSEENPILRMGALSWASPELGVEGVWRDGTRPGISRTLHESPGGAVTWCCLMPSAEATVRCGSSAVRGLGYVEQLSMTLPPWRLPIDTLRWGRFLTPTHSVVWIDWQTAGARDDRTLIFLDGMAVRGDVSEEDVFFEGGRVRVPASGRLVLREGRLSHLLRNLPGGLRTSLPARVLAIEETKWRTRGCLSVDGAAPEGGWAIHEVVRFRP